MTPQKMKSYWWAALSILALTACSGDDPTGVNYDVTTLQIIDTQIGAGAQADSGKTVTVNYNGWLYEQYTADHQGTKFDSSYDRNQPFTFKLGVHQVILGWDQGVKGMKVGGKRTLVIPSSLAYGPAGSGPIPPDRALIFDIELLSVQ